jgi:serine protease AprX
MNKDGKCRISDATKALEWCSKNKNSNNIGIISFSVGSGNPSDSNPVLDDACNRMVEKGFVMCVVAGNSGPDPGTIENPGNTEKVITVGAIYDSGRILEESSRGPTTNGVIKPDLVTLGVNVVSAKAQTRSNTSVMSGTSMAVPLVSGAAAVILQAQPNLNPSDVKRILSKTADDLGSPGPDNDYGYGALNLTRALESISVKTERLQAPLLEEVVLNKHDAPVGDAVMIEASASGDIDTINSNIIGPDRELEIPMDDFDSNGVFSARWETSFWTPGEYDIVVRMQGKFGEVDSKAVPFHLAERT